MTLCQVDPAFEITVFVVALTLAWIFDIRPWIILLILLVFSELSRFGWCFLTQRKRLPAKPKCQCAS